jgi:hypothetical protein
MGSSIAGNGGIIGASNVPTAASPGNQVTAITSNGCFNRTVASATVIVVGGGGGGAQGGGGAGGVLVTECHPLPTCAVPVTIGAGGAGRPGPGAYSAPGTSGSASTFGSATPLSAPGGGGGGGNRGNGGGGGNETAATAPPGESQATIGGANMGFNGGGGNGFQQGGGGGGGGDSAGGNSNVVGGNGGSGKNLNPYGVPGCIGTGGIIGGGGGGNLTQFGAGTCNNSNCSAGALGSFPNVLAQQSTQYRFCTGGIGGGGNGGIKVANTNGAIFQSPANGTANTGGGGGGENSGYCNGPQVGGTGGSGIVIVVEPCAASGTVGDGVYSMQAQFNAKAASRWK